MKDYFNFTNYQLNLFSSGNLRLKFILESLKSVRGRVLDLGSGDGRLGQKIKEFYPSLEIYGLEPEKKLVFEAQKRTEGIKELHYQVGKGERLPFKNNFFDAVLASCVLEHVDDYKKTLQEISRVIKPGCVFHSVTPLEAEPGVLHNWFKDRIWQKTKYYLGHQHPFTKRELLASIKKADFKIEKTWSSQFFFSQLIEIVWYKLLETFKTPADFSIIGALRKNKSDKKSFFFWLMLKLKGLLINLEWCLLRFLPGHLLHIKAIKK